MDYLEDLLINPLETDIEHNESVNEIMPDSPDAYRPFLFGFSTSILQSNYNYEMLSELTEISITKLKCPHEKIFSKLMHILTTYSSLPQHYPPQFINDQNMHSLNVKNFYAKVYNLADILILQELYKKNNILVPIIKKLLDSTMEKKYVINRLIFYLSFYIIKIKSIMSNLSEAYKNFIKTILKKISEFATEPNIVHYFTLEEMNKYHTELIKYQ